MSKDFTRLMNYIKSKKELIDSWLDKNIPKDNDFPSTLNKAIRYALFPGGKRIRPVLTLSIADIYNTDEKDLLPAACAIELIHTYSLIHDDLPCMDDDDIRRGKPTVHKVFGEAIAVLAGDALLTLAFEIMADPTKYSNPNIPRILWIIKEIAEAAGYKGMVAGQVLDIEGEGKKVSINEVELIHKNKTAKMIEVSIKIGAILCGAGYREIEKLSEYARKIGLAFQIVDDILGEIGDESKLGKPVNKDKIRKKATYPSVLGIEKSKIAAKKLIEEAKNSLNIFEEDKVWMLKDLADYIVERDK